MAFDLNGAWAADDGGLYYVRQQGNLVVWAGLHASGFHMGIQFANVFYGKFSADGTTLSGYWVDVPRGKTNGHGKLAVEIAEVQLPFPPPFPPVTMLEMRRIDAQTTGGFSGSKWARNGSRLGPRDVAELESRVQRFDGIYSDNNPPLRDFSVMWGRVGAVSGPNPLPPKPDDYCSFLKDDWPGDGDFDFDLNPDWDLTEAGFWTSGWQTFPPFITSLNTFSLGRWNEWQVFHCEGSMWGRANDDDHCTEEPIILLPGWHEQDGNSILINGRPINAQMETITDDDTGEKSLRFRLGQDGSEVVMLTTDTLARVTGVAADDTGWHGFDRRGDNPPEIHPVYAVDVVQNFTKPRAPFTNLTGVWHGDDAGTYYLRQIGSDVRWLGLSRDQGRSFANVFQGTVDGDTITGSWLDVPLGQDGVLGGGSLVLYGSDLETHLFKKEQVGHFGATVWTKLYDTAATHGSPTPPRPPIGPSKRVPTG